MKRILKENMTLEGLREMLNAHLLDVQNYVTYLVTLRKNSLATHDRRTASFLQDIIYVYVDQMDELAAMADLDQNPDFRPDSHPFGPDA